MSKEINVSPSELTFEPVNAGQQSDDKEVEIRNIGTETVLVSGIGISLNFLFRERGIGSFGSTLPAFKLGVEFIPGQWYFKSLIGGLTTDASETGITVGQGNPDGSLHVIIGDYILDNDDTPILDNDDSGIEGVE